MDVCREIPRANDGLAGVERQMVNARACKKDFDLVLRKCAVGEPRPVEPSVELVRVDRDRPRLA